MPNKTPPHDEVDEGWFASRDEAPTSTRKRERSLELAKVQIAALDNAPGDRFRLRLTLACQDDVLTGASASYELRLRQCLVRLDTSECRPDFSTTYTYTLPDEEWSQNDTGRRTRDDGKDAGVEANIGIGAKVKETLSAAVKAGFKRKHSRIERSERSTQSRRRFDLIGFTGYGWSVGDGDEGDPRRGGWLRSTYFTEQPDRPLCAITMKPKAKLATVTARVHVRMGQLDGDVLDQRGRPKRPIGNGDAEDVARTLRARLMGMVVSKALHAAQRDRYPDLPPNEFILAEDGLEAHRPGRHVASRTNAGRRSSDVGRSRRAKTTT